MRMTGQGCWAYHERMATGLCAGQIGLIEAKRLSEEIKPYGLQSVGIKAPPQVPNLVTQ